MFGIEKNKMLRITRILVVVLLGSTSIPHFYWLEYAIFANSTGRRKFKRKER
jgi:hypothetical protein